MTAFRYFGIHLETDRLNEHKRRVKLDEPQVILRVATPGGRVRDVPLDRERLIGLIGEAALALRNLERLEGEQ